MTRTAFVADRRAVDTWRAALASERDLYEPRTTAGRTEWQLADGAGIDDRLGLDRIAGTPRPPLTSAKRFFFPEREVLLRWSRDVASGVLPEPRRFVLFGVQSCDIAAIAYQDRFFAGDAAYQARRSRALLVGVSCLAACPGGFCRDVGAGPFASAGFDVSLTPLDGGAVVVEVGTAAGDASLRVIAGELRPIDADARAGFDAARTTAEATFPSRPFVGRAIERVNGSPGAAPVREAEWRALGPSCMTCTGCTSVCPTCSCFTVVDERSGDADDRGFPPAGERVRRWDSCLLEGFQREASGHHPAPDAGDRVHRFWFHKLSREFAGFDRIGCVGCGRCDIACPGSIGALQVMAALGAPDAMNEAQPEHGLRHRSAP